MQQVDEALQKADDAVGGVAGVLEPADRKPFDFSTIKSKFTRGESLLTPDGSDTQDIPISGGGKGSGASDSRLEFIHLGWIHHDAQPRFGHTTVDDLELLDLADIPSTRAIAFRAALEREAILVSGYLRGVRDALAEMGKEPPKPEESSGVALLNQLMGFLGGVFGGPAAGSIQASTVDLNPLITELGAAAKRIDTPNINYKALHEAGVKLHEVRTKCYEYMAAQFAKMEGAGPPGTAAGLPFIGEMIPGEIGKVLGFVQSYSQLAVSIYPQLVLGMQLAMWDGINDAVRARSIAAIRERFTPIFPVWYKPPEEEAPPSSGGGGPGGPLGDIADALGTVEEKIDAAADFFTVPFESTPGGPFVEQAFKIPKDRQVGVLDRSTALATLASDAFETVLGKDKYPGTVRDINIEIFKVICEFLRSAYNKLVIVGDVEVPATSLIEAGRAHLVDAIVEILFEKLDFLDPIRAFEFPLTLGPKTVPVNTEALIALAKQKLIEVVSFLDVVIEYALGDLADVLNGARKSAGKSMSMEVHLAVLPMLHARLFFNIIRPVWDAVMNAIKEALVAALAPVAGEMFGALGTVGGYVNKVQQVVDRAQEAKRAFDDGLQMGTGGSNLDQWAALGRDLADAPGGGGPEVAVDPTFPFTDRKTQGAGMPVSQSQYAEVATTHKWDEAEPPKPETPPPA